jgi:phosphoribosylformimino-5-aminoimidazole carboxamide ribotide isomerase
MTIIPAIDIIDGKCVRLTKGDYTTSTIYNHDPLEVAKQFEVAGLQRLHLVDLDGARTATPKNWKVLERIATRTDLQIDFSGGIHSQKIVNETFNAGAWYVTLGSIAVRNEMLVSGWIIAYGAERFIIAADVLEDKIMIKGWTEPTDKTVYDLIDRYKAVGIKQFICTDINCDGMLKGASVELYKKIMSRQKSIKLIASGGVSSMKDLSALKETGCSGVIVGKAIYENKIKLSELC